jgi:hypothetical protein
MVAAPSSSTCSTMAPDLRPELQVLEEEQATSCGTKADCTPLLAAHPRRRSQSHRCCWTKRRGCSYTRLLERRTALSPSLPLHSAGNVRYRGCPYPNLVAAELLQELSAAVASQQICFLVDEVYCQLMKQLPGSPAGCWARQGPQRAPSCIGSIRRGPRCF